MQRPNTDGNTLSSYAIFDLKTLCNLAGMFSYLIHETCNDSWIIEAEPEALEKLIPES